MELPAPVGFLLVHGAGRSAGQLVPLLFLVMCQSHCLYRTFPYPLRVGGRGTRIPVLVVDSGFFFNTIHAYINARFILEFGSGARQAPDGEAGGGDPSGRASTVPTLADVSAKVDQGATGAAGPERRGGGPRARSAQASGAGPVVKAAIGFTALTAVRSGEARGRRAARSTSSHG